MNSGDDLARTPASDKGSPSGEDHLEERIGHTLSPTRMPLPALTGVPVEPTARARHDGASHSERRGDPFAGP